MCGIFGFAAKTKNDSIDTRAVIRAAIGVEPRGPHAWGVAFVRAGRLFMYKQPGSIKHDRRKLAELVEGATMVIGHCRWATHGHPSDNATNHPHPSDAGWLVHNGQIEYAEAFRRDFGLLPTTECDSELIGQLAAEENGPMWKRLGAALEYAQAYSRERPAHAAAWLGKSAMHVARAGKPLYIATGTRHWFGWSTTGIGLSTVKLAPDNRAFSLRYVSDAVTVSSHAIPTQSVADGNQAY